MRIALIVGIVFFVALGVNQALFAQVVNIESRRVDAKKPGWQGYGELWF
jgi:hypothetical protein